MHAKDRIDPQIVIETLGLPLVVKPVEAGSSVGMSIVREAAALPVALDQAFEHGPEVLVEAFIEGIEITGGVLGNQTLEALPLIEIIPGKGYEFFDYQAKYQAGATEEICPARINADLTAIAQHYALEAHKALRCRGYSRTDMILRGSDFFVLETNTIPGMTATSLFPQAAQKAGYSFSQLLERLIELSLEGRNSSR
jgi:D-alanine-D-alanine ligase